MCGHDGKDAMRHAVVRTCPAPATRTRQMGEVASAVLRYANLNGFVQECLDEEWQILHVDRTVVDGLVELSELCVCAAAGVVGELQHQT